MASILKLNVLLKLSELITTGSVFISAPLVEIETLTILVFKSVAFIITSTGKEFPK